MIPLLGLFVSLVQFAAPATDAPRAQDVEWVNQPGDDARIQTASRLDAAMDAAEIRGGLVTAGLTKINFKLSGEYIVEVFVAAQDAGRQSFVLEADRMVIDANLRLRNTGVAVANAPIGFRVLTGIVRGPAELAVRSSAAEYAVSAVRWRTREEYERDVVPKVLARARQVAADPSVIPGAAERQRVLRQLWERAAIARDSATAREAWVGMTRAFYWETMRNPDPGHMARLEELLMRSLRISADDPVVHGMISNACSGANLLPGTKAAFASPEYGSTSATGLLCKDGKPVAWRSAAQDRVDAPAWANEQRKLRIRLEEIATYWADKRLKTDGAFGDAWSGDLAGIDAAMMRNWAPLAAGLGSRIAARGMETLAAGLFKSGLLEHAYDKRPGVAAVSARLTTDTLPALALIRPSEAAARMRETAQCLSYWSRKQGDGVFRIEREGFNCREFEPDSRYVDSYRNLDAVGPALWYAALSRDAETQSRLWYWADSWLKVMRTGDGGKPIGIIPEEVFSADGSFVGSETGWTADHWSPEGQRAIAGLFAAMFDLTQDKRWQLAAEEALTVAPPPPPVVVTEAELEADEDAAAPVPAAPPRPAAVAMQAAALPKGLIQRIRGKRTLPEFFGWDADWNPELLTQLAREAQLGVANNLAMLTTEALFSDRVFYAVPEGYQRHLFGGPAPRPDQYPGFAVSWTPGREEYARAVVSAADDGLKLKLFNFEPGFVNAAFRAWRLQPGRYRWVINETKSQGEMEVDAARREFSIPIPPSREVTIEIRKR